ncbi:hypothetical protein L596_007857 [Steinernema carpocapsae]|uniref:Uncharacterized protein n=1 Tax=Steinernema carpocapsae TaxID=34508 RepID=A0A4U5PB73_STECR|nr:hypothetical protein L596_007857 [Steinernema carpocapsae]
MEQKEEPTSAECLEDLVPASHYLLQNRAVEERKAKEFNTQLAQSIDAQKKALQEMGVASESMVETDDRMTKHIVKMIEVNKTLKQKLQRIEKVGKIKSVNEEADDHGRRIPVAVVQFSKRRIVNGFVRYNGGEVETSEDVVTTFGRPEEEHLTEERTLESADEVTILSLSGCSDCDFELMEKILKKKNCDKCGRTRGSYSSSLSALSSQASSEYNMNTSSVFSSDEDSGHRSDSMTGSSSDDRTPTSSADSVDDGENE